MSHTLKEDAKGVKHLHQRGQSKLCPFISGIPYQDEYKRTGVIQVTCNSNCAHFDIQNDGKRVKLSCGTGPAFIINTEPEKTTQNSTLQLHKA